MAKCARCNKEMSFVDGCGIQTVMIGGKVFSRVRVGDPGDFAEGESIALRCHDCNALYGHCHHWGCDAERCPACGRQLISCDCGNAAGRHGNQTQKAGASRRAVCYCRVAHPDQVALDKQVRLNSAFALDRGYGIVATIAESGSGTGMNRPGLMMLLEHLRQPDFDVLIVNGLNRLGRNLSLVLPLLMGLREKGIRVESPVKGAGCDLLENLPILRNLGQKRGASDVLWENEGKKARRGSHAAPGSTDCGTCEGKLPEGDAGRIGEDG